jgi:DNA-binding response OmpR family regulator
MSDQMIKVLVVDDEEGLADFMQKILQLEGYMAFMETDGMGAVNFFKAERPDIILIDVALGYSKIDGIEVLKRIKEMDQNAMCLMVTRVTDEETVKKAKEFGAMHYVLKPLDRKDIIAVVKEAAEIIKQRRASNG